MRKTILTTATTAATTIAAAVALAAALGANLAAGLAPAAAQMVDGPKVNWKFSVWGKSRAFTRGVEHLAAQADERTGGKFQIRIGYGEQFSKSRENLDSVSLGAIQGAMFCSSYHPGKNKPITVLDLPFLPFADLDVMRAAQDAVYAHPASREALAKWNALLFMGNVLPPNEFMGRRRPLLSVNDFEGMRVRALAGIGEAAKLLGATPLTMPASEVYTSFQQGAVDAVSFPFTYAFAAFKVDELATWTTTNIKIGSSNCPTAINLQAWNALPEQYRQLLLDAKDGAHEALKAAYAADDVKNMKRWREEGKIRLIEIPEAEMVEFRRAGGEPIWKQWVEDNEGELPARELLDLVLATAKKGAM